MKKLLFTLLSFITIQKIQAQEKDFRSWNIININQQIVENFTFQSDIQYRTWEKLDQLNQLLIRGGVGYDLSKNNNTILLGVAYIATRNPITDDSYNTFQEHRIYQQFNTKHKISKVNLNHRFRFEERLMNDDIFFRFRYQFNATLPLNKPSLTKNAFFIKASNELFLNAIKTNEFDRNRLNFNLGYVLTPKLTIEAGYMKQHVKHTQTNHLMLGITLNNPINKKPS